MRTQLLTLATALTLAAFATTAVAATAGSASGGGSSGGGGGFSSGSSGGGSSSGGGGGSSGGGSSGGGGGSSSGGGGGGGGSAHGGSSGGGGGGGGFHGGGGGGRSAGGEGGHSGWSNLRGNEFGGHSNSGGYTNSALQSRDIARGGYRVLDTQAARVVASTATPIHGAPKSFDLGPRMGSAANAMRMNDDKRRVVPVPRPGQTTPVHHVFTAQSGCARYTCRPYRLDEMCPHWLIGDSNNLVWTQPLYCGQPEIVRLKPSTAR